MKRLAMLTACVGLLLPGCGGPDDAKPAAQSKRNGGPQQAKTPIVRSLLRAVDEVEGEDEQAKQQLRQILHESDEELSQVLGENSRKLIEKANKKPFTPVIGAPEKPSADTP